MKNNDEKIAEQDLIYEINILLDALLL